MNNQHIASHATTQLPSAYRISDELFAQIEHAARAVEAQVVAWRRDIHSHPELSGQEVRTAGLVADHLRELGLEVRTGVGGHGVVGLLHGARPGKVVALRADMDALPVKELSGLPFASQVRAINMGQETAVAHACGHDGHTAILLGVASVLTGLRVQIAGSVKFVFQPAEEGCSSPPAEGETWGAAAMLADGALDNPSVDAMFGLHIVPQMPVGSIGYRIGPLSASADTVKIKITGRQTHGGYPWAGVDPIVAASQVVLGLQTIVSRQVDLTHEPVVISIGAFRGGYRENIIPDEVELLGTVRTFDAAMRADVGARITRTAQAIAGACEACAETTFSPSNYAAVINPRELTEQSLPALHLASDGRTVEVSKQSFAEDFSLFQQKVPAMFMLLGAMPNGMNPRQVAPNHSPAFVFNEDALCVGVKALSTVAIDYLEQA